MPAEFDPLGPPAAPSRRLRSFELLLVLFVAFAGSVAISLYVVFSNASLYGSETSPTLNFATVIQEIAGLGVLFYVLFRQGRRPRDLGFTFNWKDLPLSVWLAFAAVVVGIIASSLLSYGYRQATGQPLNTTPKNVEFISAGFSLWTLVVIVINPFFEELIVRAYLISEIQSLTGSAALAVGLSVALQVTYHLYQGLTSALLSAAIFAVFSLYYVKTKRIVPVILAHFYFDFMAVAYYWWR